MEAPMDGGRIGPDGGAGTAGARMRAPDGSPDAAPGRLRALRLDQRFVLAGSLVSLVGMVVMGAWVSGEIEDSVTRNSAISAALYMESFVAPLSQELAGADALKPGTVARLDEVLGAEPFVERIAAVKIWKDGGLVAFSTDPALIGRRIEPTGNLRRAWAGELVAEFGGRSHEEGIDRLPEGVPLLEVYNPVHSILTGEIIAVAEFYQDATELEQDLAEARLTSWVVVGGIGLATFALLFGIVRSGSLTIERQHRELEARLEEVARVSRQNEALRRRIQDASLRASETNERLLRRVSAELHDGPAQALALVSLRLGSLGVRAGSGEGEGEAEVVRRSLDEALRDIRNLCRGLSLPELEGRRVAEVVELAAGAHERRTGTEVAVDALPAGEAEGEAGHSTLICVYRFVQEGLMNAFRHAGGRGQRVAARIAGESLEVSVEDEGPGIAAQVHDAGAGGLGLRGLRERVESMGGEFRVESRPGAGTRLVMRLAHGGPDGG